MLKIKGSQALWIIIVTLGLAGACPAQKQSISFGTLPDKAEDDEPFNVTATSGSGLPVTFEASPATVCKATADGVVTVIGKGTCTVTASVAAGGGFDAAAQVSRSFVIRPISGVDVVLGIGSLITGNHTDYRINSTSNTIEGTQIGRASPQLLAGLAFQLPVPGFTSSNPKPWHMFVSLKFDPKAQESIIGYTFGLTYRVQKYLDLLAGYALTPFSEPSPGFVNAAAIAVNKYPASYTGFNSDTIKSGATGAFDGFPLLDKNPPTGAQSGLNLYPGSPLASHYRGGFMLGVSVPVSLKSKFR